MSVVALCSLKGAPGVTTLALALTAAASTDVAAGLIEADPAGGDVAGFIGLSTEPGVITLAASCRRPDAPLDFGPHAQALPAGGWVIVGSTDPVQQSSAIAGFGGRLAEAVRQSGWVGFVDCGRWSPQSMAARQVREADYTLVVIRPSIGQIEALRTRVADLRNATAGRVGVVLTDTAPYGAEDIELAVGLRVLGVVRQDPKGVMGLYGARRLAERAPILRSARAILANPPPDDLAGTLDLVKANGAERVSGGLR